MGFVVRGFNTSIFHLVKIVKIFLPLLIGFKFQNNFSFTNLPTVKKMFVQDH